MFRYRTGVPGGICPTGSGRGRRCGNGITASPPTGPGIGCWRRCRPTPTPTARSTGTSVSTPRSHVLISIRQRPSGRTGGGPASTQGAGSNDKNLQKPQCCHGEPGDHALGRSRGGLSTKTHAAVDGRGRPLAILLTPGQAGDAPMCLPVLAAIRVGHHGPGRPRTRPDRVLGDKAYSSRAIRAHLRERGITSVIPEPDDQKGHRTRRGAAGGRPVSYDPITYRGGTTSNAPSTSSRTGARPGHPLRQARRHLPRRPRPRRRTHVATAIRRCALAAGRPSGRG